jgi:hypothetical protein
MHREYHRWFSQRLQRDMEMLVFGHAGAKVIVFPTRDGITGSTVRSCGANASKTSYTSGTDAPTVASTGDAWPPCTFDAKLGRS